MSVATPAVTQYLDAVPAPAQEVRP
jgi:hypothetical protein